MYTRVSNRESKISVNLKIVSEFKILNFKNKYRTYSKNDVIFWKNKFKMIPKLTNNYKDSEKIIKLKFWIKF